MTDKRPAQKSNKPKSGKQKSPFIITYVLMFTTWIILSGRYDLFHLVLGVISCFIVTYLSYDLLFTSINGEELIKAWVRFILYIPWLLIQILKANIHVMILVFHPRMMELIDPGIIKFKSRLTSDMSITTFANSITLTPGTITVFATGYGDFEVHVIDKPSGEALPGDMELRIAKIFDE